MRVDIICNIMKNWFGFFHLPGGKGSKTITKVNTDDKKDTNTTSTKSTS